MAKFLFKKKFQAQMDALEEEMDRIRAQKAELLLREVGLEEPFYFHLLALHEQLVFEVADRGILLQLNSFCDDKSRLKFVMSKQKFMLGRDLFRFMPGAGSYSTAADERRRRIRERQRKADETGRH